MTHYDVVIIGSGTAGQTVAADCAKAGKSVAVIDRLPFGGTCSLRGCIPKKVLLAGVEAVERANVLVGRGVTGGCGLDWPSLVARKREYTDPVPDKTVEWMRKSGMDVIHGTATFTSSTTLEVDGAPIEAENFVIATGAKPIDLGIEGQQLLLTSTDFLAMDEMPSEIALVGGGYISFEFALLAHLAGAKVTIVHRSGQVLSGFDGELANQLAEKYRGLGIDIWLDAPVQEIARTADGRLALHTPHGTLTVDAAFHGAGRVPDLEDLNLDAADVAGDHHGVAVDEHLRSTTNPRVFAAGDAAATGTPLTPVAGAQGEVVSANILGAPAVFDGSATPSVVFTTPPLARVGLLPDHVTDNDEYKVESFDMSTWFTQSRVGNDAAGARIVIERKTGAIKGAHLLSVDADEVINVFALAIRMNATLDDLKKISWSYPTFSYDINYLIGRY